MRKSYRSLTAVKWYLHIKPTPACSIEGGSYIFAILSCYIHYRLEVTLNDLVSNIVNLIAIAGCAQQVMSNVFVEFYL